MAKQKKIICTPAARDGTERRPQHQHCHSHILKHPNLQTKNMAFKATKQRREEGRKRGRNSGEAEENSAWFTLQKKKKKNPAANFIIARSKKSKPPKKLKKRQENGSKHHAYRGARFRKHARDVGNKPAGHGRRRVPCPDATRSPAAAQRVCVCVCVGSKIRPEF